MAQIIITLQNQVIGKHVISPASELTIGRHTNNAIVIDHMSVSSRHASIRLQGDELMLTDLGSTNGTFVNNQRVSEARLAHQDWISVGNHMLIVDIYESLSLESTAKMLMEAGSAASNESEQTIMVDMRPGPAAADISFDTLTFLSGGQGDYELFKSKITIGKNKDADIAISGFWSFLAGSPSAIVFRKGGVYALDYVDGVMKPKVNGLPVKNNTLLNTGDIIEIGPLKMQINFKGR
jgi:predicted component of type VI protein secretion system